MMYTTSQKFGQFLYLKAEATIYIDNCKNLNYLSKLDWQMNSVVHL